MNKQQISSVQNALRQRKLKVEDNPLWRQISEEFDIGCVRGRYIHLSNQDLDMLQQAYDKRLGQSVVNVDLDVADRIAMAKQVSDEKWAKGGVFESLLAVARNNLQPLPIKSKETVVTPPGTVFSLRPDMLDVGGISSLLIIENGTLMTHWPEMMPLLPDVCGDALIIYRGHQQNLAMLNELLGALAEETPVYVFFDFDAAGFDMALQLVRFHKLRIVFPQLWQNINQQPAQTLIRINKPDEYEKQYQQLIRRINDPKTPVEVVKVLNYLQLHHLAITQEHIVQCEWQLTMTKEVVSD